MSIYRQLWLAIIISMLLALGGSLFASLLSARSYLEQQLTMKNADNAAVLALALGQQNPDQVTVELAIAAVFDSGHYESILVIDPAGKVLIERVSPPGDIGAPVWFAELLPLVANAGEAQISSGWTQFGKIVLVSQSRFAYEALWSSTKEMIVALILAGFIGGYLGTLIMRRLRDPLSAVVRQAEAISDRRFVTIPEPNVPELRKLAKAMNTTVTRIKDMFDEEAARLETVRREANCDRLTGLANREFFMAQLRASLEDENAKGGALLLIRIADLAGVNKRLGRAATDDLLKRVAATISASIAPGADDVAARMNGADFALRLEGMSADRSRANLLLNELVKAMDPFLEGGPAAYIGFGVFKQGTELGGLLAQVDAALVSAESDGVNGVREAAMATDDDTPRSAEHWSAVIHQSLEKRWIRLISFPVVTMQRKLMHEECPLRLKFDPQGEWLPAGRFLPVAERLGLTGSLDLAALALGLTHLEQQPALAGVGINLSASSLTTENFQQDLHMLLSKHPQAATRLWVEVAETGALKHLEIFRELCGVLKEHHCHVGIEHFGRHFSQIGQLHDLGLDYIKVDASFVRGIESNQGNQSFLKGLRSIAHNIGMRVIGEGVTSTEEFSALAALGFDGATGPGVKVTTGIG